MKKFNYQKCMEEHNGYAVTRNGRKARLLCNDLTGCYSIVAIVAIIGEVEEVLSFWTDGLFNHAGEETEFDLFTPLDCEEGQGL